MCKKLSEKSEYLYGIDSSLSNTGVSIYDLNQHKFVFVGSVNTDKVYATKEFKGLNLHGLKLNKISNFLKELTEKYPPKYISIERGFSRFKNETQALFRVFGIIQEMFWDKPQELYPPNTVKSTIVHGHADKNDLEKVINDRYKYITINNDHESDAVAVALTYLIKNKLISWEKPDWEEIKKERGN